MQNENIDENLMRNIISLSKRRGFIFPSSEIYDGFSAVYDYGPYGVEVANAIKREWWKYMVQYRNDIVGLDSAVFMSPKVWEASGHIEGFSDPLSECKNCNLRLRVDHLLCNIGIFADEKMSDKKINKIFSENKKNVVCPKCGKSDFTNAKKFNLLVKSNLGNFTENWPKNPVYLRGETCQGIYINYKNILDSTRVKIPFGVAQIGKAFRNEITARQFIFRTREFEQMEMQYFTNPDLEMNEYEKLREYRFKQYIDLGIKRENLRWRKHENLVFYAKEAYDIEYKYPFGFRELEGVHARGNYDLSRHSKFSGKDLSYFDYACGKRYIPHIIESSAGVGRTMLALLCDAYNKENINGKERIVMKFSDKIAPIKAAVFPLLKNKPKLVGLAKEIFNKLKLVYMCEFDDNDNIGKRYRRQDEIGTPYCITVDFDSLCDNTVTIRDRDTMKQERIKIEKIEKYLSNNISV